MNRFFILVFMLIGCSESFLGERELGRIGAEVEERLYYDSKLSIFGAGSS
jgi:hypothetical protein